jgi:hypothetical protein
MKYGPCSAQSKSKPLIVRWHSRIRRVMLDDMSAEKFYGGAGGPKLCLGT